MFVHFLNTGDVMTLVITCSEENEIEEKIRTRSKRRILEHGSCQLSILLHALLSRFSSIVCSCFIVIHGPISLQPKTCIDTSMKLSVYSMFNHVPIAHLGQTAFSHSVQYRLTSSLTWVIPAGKEARYALSADAFYFLNMHFFRGL